MLNIIANKIIHKSKKYDKIKQEFNGRKHFIAWIQT